MILDALRAAPHSASPSRAGQSHLTEASTLPRPNGEREGPAPQAREGEGDAQLSRCFLKQTSLPMLPLTFPSLMRWVPSSPRGERRKGTPLPNAIALPLRGRVRVGGCAKRIKIMSSTPSLSARSCAVGDIAPSAALPPTLTSPARGEVIQDYEIAACSSARLCSTVLPAVSTTASALL